MPFLLLICNNYVHNSFLEFEEFCQLSAKFLIEEDEEGMKKELKEAFRIYDKEGKYWLDYHLVSNAMKGG